MSGHNKWSKVKHKKAATDAKKSAEFSKYAKLITFESKKANGDTTAPSLKLAIERAKKGNMPNDNIERAVTRGLGEQDNAEEMVYEAYGPAGVALIITTLTDNKNRTVGDIKNTLNKQNASLAEQGSASWAFEKDENGEWVAQTKIPISENDTEKIKSLKEKLMELDDVQYVYTNAGTM